MSEQTSYIGVDIGHRRFSAAVPGAKPRDFDHSEAGVGKLIDWASVRLPSPYMAACESSGIYSTRFACLLRDRGIACAIVPPQRVRANAAALGRRSKTDQIDAQVILDYAMHARPKPWTAPPPEQQQLALMLRVRENFATDCRRWRNRLHALEQLPDCPQALIDSHQALIGHFKAQRLQFAREITKLRRQHNELQERYVLLQTVPGVGPEVAMAVLARADIFLSRSDKELTAYAGLAPQHRQSGSSLKGRSRIGKSGDKRLRTLLYMAAMSASQHNPQLKELYNRMLKDGHKPKSGFIAVARKLMLQIRSVLKSGRPFTPYLNGGGIDT